MGTLSALVHFFLHKKLFEPRSISSLSRVIVQVSIVSKKTVGDSDSHFDNLSVSPLQSQSDFFIVVDGVIETHSIKYHLRMIQNHFH